MGVRTWSKSEIEYGRKMFNSGIEGARSGRAAFLNGESNPPFLSESVADALPPALLGVCLGVLGSYSYKRPISLGKTLVYGLLGGVLGFSAGIAWGNRRLVATVASGALKNMSKVCDEHWLERHPIDYA